MELINNKKYMEILKIIIEWVIWLFVFGLLALIPLYIGASVLFIIKTLIDASRAGGR